MCSSYGYLRSTNDITCALSISDQFHVGIYKTNQFGLRLIQTLICTNLQSHLEKHHPHRDTVPIYDNRNISIAQNSSNLGPSFYVFTHKCCKL